MARRQFSILASVAILIGAVLFLVLRPNRSVAPSHSIDRQEASVTNAPVVGMPGATGMEPAGIGLPRQSRAAMTNDRG